MSLLSIQHLAVAFKTRHGPVQALHDVSLAVDRGETLGLVGESGSGKSVTALAAMRLLDRAGRITAGRITFDGRDITEATPAGLRQLRGSAISMVFQNPRTALNPIRTVGRQIADVLRAHTALSAAEAREEALAALEAVLIRDPAARFHAYPGELSGGMCQRVMIAMALACGPALLIADEPTTGLDVVTQRTVMDLLAGLAAVRGMAMVLITHDLGLAARHCGRIAVMERGRTVEHGPTAALFNDPRHSCTRRLIAASPTRISTLADLVPGTAAAPHPLARQPGANPLLEVRGITKTFPGGTRAVNRVSFAIPAGGSLGLVGESGSGKSTLSRIICRLVDADAGDVLLAGEPIGAIPARDFHRSPRRRDVQIVFQDPHDSLNPRSTAWNSIAHPLRRLEGLGGPALDGRVAEAAERAGLPAALLDRFPHQLSGGEKARVGIARALAPRPRLLVLDEPTAALDTPVQATVLQLLDRLRRDDGLTLLFVSHDLNVVRMMCDDLVVLQNGLVVETGRSMDVFARPRSAYTQQLLDAVPHLESSWTRPGEPGSGS